ARLGDVPRSALSYQHAHDILGWEPRVSIVEGVAKTVDYFRTTQQLH
ncbi:MAG: UDP-glucose 4-epimerase, partial [Corynebacterium matruchotii]